MIKTVYLDMDGVLVNFRKGIHEAFVKPYHYPTLSKKWTFWDDWPEVTFEMVNAVCDTLFWQDLEWMHDGVGILEAVFDKFQNNQIYLLTTPMPNVQSPTGKWLWVCHQLPAFYKHTIITQAPKYLLARPDTLLIDDKDENVDRFREAGGKAILINRPWNRGHLNADKTVQMLQEFLGKL